MSDGVVTSFDELPGGQQLALVGTGDDVTQWTWDGDAMVNAAGTKLDPWFFSGALTAGRVRLADFSPPRINEWFSPGGERDRHYLVVDVSGKYLDHPMVGRFTRGRFDDFRQSPNIVARHSRCPAPEWANDAVVDLAIRAYALSVDQLKLSRQVQNVRASRDYLTWAQDYLGRAITRMEERSE